jgi:hypothetical protein
MHCRLLVTDQNVADARLSMQRVVKGQNSSTRVTKDDVDA